MIIFWLLPASAALHIVEEFIFPGGFTAWYKDYMKDVSSSFTTRYLVIINVVLIVFCILPLFMDTLQGASLWLIVASIVTFNSFFHIKGTYDLKKYSPGVITSVFLYIPLTIYGYIYLITTNKASVETALASAIMGIGYWVFSYFNHKRRAKRVFSKSNNG